MLSGSARGGHRFRHGPAMRISGYVQIRDRLLGRGKQRWLKLAGEVLSIHDSESQLPSESWDCADLQVESVGPHSFRVRLTPEGIKRDNEKHSRMRRSRRARFTGDFGVAAQDQKVGRKNFVNGVVFGVESRKMAKTWVDSLEYACSRRFQRWYNLGTILGTGSYGKVYRCTEKETGAEFCVKILKRKTYQVSYVGWIDREMSAAATLWHENVVAVVDAFATKDKVYLVMELMKGGTLQDYLDIWKKLPLSYSKVVAREMLKGLAFIHSLNVVHRDIKPGNVFMSETKFPTAVRLGDFGFCNFLERGKVDSRVMTTQIGTLAYAAREIALREKYGPGADLWSAGVVIYEMLSGRNPFVGKTPRETYSNIRAGVVTFEHEAWKGIPEEPKSLIKQLLQVDPNKRISAFAALQHDWFTDTGKGNIDALSQNFPSFKQSGTLSVGDSTSAPVSLRSVISPPLSTNSVASLDSQRLRLAVASPSIKRIQSVGLLQASRENPAIIRRLLSSPVVQKQLNVALPYRRKLVIVGRAFLAIARMRALAAGTSLTRNASKFENDPTKRLWDAVPPSLLGEGQTQETSGYFHGKYGKKTLANGGIGRSVSMKSQVEADSSAEGDHSTNIMSAEDAFRASKGSMSDNYLGRPDVNARRRRSTAEAKHSPKSEEANQKKSRAKIRSNQRGGVKRRGGKAKRDHLAQKGREAGAQNSRKKVATSSPPLSHSEDVDGQRRSSQTRRTSSLQELEDASSKNLSVRVEEFSVSRGLEDYTLKSPVSDIDTDSNSIDLGLEDEERSLVDSLSDDADATSIPLHLDPDDEIVVDHVRSEVDMNFATALSFSQEPNFEDLTRKSKNNASPHKPQFVSLKNKSEAQMSSSLEKPTGISPKHRNIISEPSHVSNLSDPNPEPLTRRTMPVNPRRRVGANLNTPRKLVTASEIQMSDDGIVKRMSSKFESSAGSFAPTRKEGLKTKHIAESFADNYFVRQRLQAFAEG